MSKHSELDIKRQGAKNIKHKLIKNVEDLTWRELKILALKKDIPISAALAFLIEYYNNSKK